MSRDGFKWPYLAAFLTLIFLLVLYHHWSMRSVNRTEFSSNTIELRGSIGDGPIIGANVIVYSASGKQLASEISDNTANYAFNYRFRKKQFPLIIKADGGTDLVTGLDPSFELISTAIRRAKKINVNLNPFSTFITKTALSSPDGLTNSNYNKAKKAIFERFSFGLDANSLRDPVRSRIRHKNIANIVKASELFAEMIRRTRSILTVAAIKHTNDEIIDILASDFSDGIIDGRGPKADTLVAAIANIISGQVLIEGLTNQLRIDGTIITDNLDNAIRVTMPSATKLTSDIPITKQMLLQSEVAVAATQAIATSPELSNLIQLLKQLPANSSANHIASLLPEYAYLYFKEALSRVTTATKEELEMINKVVRTYTSEEEELPEITLWANPPTVDSGESVTLNWSSKNASSCIASGAWTGSKALKGVQVFGPLTSNSHFNLSCKGADGEANASVSVKVNQPSVSVKLTADAEVIPFHGTVNLTWTSSNAQSCSASGAWSGNKKPVGNELVGPLNSKSSFVLTCSGKEEISSSTVVVLVGTPPPTVTLTAKDPSLPYNSPIILTWSSTNANSCTASGSWSGAKALNGDQNVGLIKENSTFFIECKGEGGIAAASEKITCINCTTDFNLVLSWDKNPDFVTGYKIYRGSTVNTITEELSDIPIANSVFDPEQPSIRYHYSSDLNLTFGDEVCFKVRAYNEVGISGFSEATCTKIW